MRAGSVTLRRLHLENRPSSHIAGGGQSPGRLAARKRPAAGWWPCDTVRGLTVWNELILATRRRRVALIALSAVLILFAAWLFFRHPAAPVKAEESNSITVTVAAARRGDVESAADFIATVQAFNTVVVHAQVDGVVDRVVYKEGAAVRRGDLLAVLDKRSFAAGVRAAVAQREKDIAQYDNVRRDVARYEFLVKTDSAPAQTLDTTRALAAQLKAAVATDQAQIDQARLQLGYTTIRSPIDGRVGARLVDAGNVVHVGDAGGLVVVTQLHPILASFAVPQTLLAQLRQQQNRAALKVTAHDSADQHLLASGELTFIDTQVDAATGTLRCKATFANADETLWPGAFVTVHLMLGTVKDAVLVPTRAVKSADRQFSVMVVTPGNTVTVRAVVPGPAVAGDTVITRGLAPGEQVVVDGGFQLEEGGHVTVRPAAAPLPAPAAPAAAVEKPA